LNSEWRSLRLSLMQSRSHLTVRGLPREVYEALAAEKRRRGTSLNQTVIDLLASALGVSSGELRTNGLERLAGTWREADYEEFQQATAPFGDVDEELWR
jgi:kynureninase